MQKAEKAVWVFSDYFYGSVSALCLVWGLYIVGRVCDVVSTYIALSRLGFDIRYEANDTTRWLMAEFGILPGLALKDILQLPALFVLISCACCLIPHNRARRIVVASSISAVAGISVLAAASNLRVLGFYTPDLAGMSSVIFGIIFCATLFIIGYGKDRITATGTSRESNLLE